MFLKVWSWDTCVRDPGHLRLRIPVSSKNPRGFSSSETLDVLLAQALGLMESKGPFGRFF